jgi:hypothetical protein
MRTILPRALRVVSAVVLFCIPHAALAQSGASTLRAGLDMRFDCVRPWNVSNYVMKGDFSALLNRNGTASADLALNGFLIDSRIHFDAKLGGRPQAAPGGTSSLRVVSRNQLRATWSLPNNDLILIITTAGNSCSVNLLMKLKPGHTEYSMWGGSKFYYCTAGRLVGSTCEAR